MRTLLRALFRKLTPKGPTSRRSARFDVESLEGRQMLTVTYHGGNLLTHVEVQALYLGSDWAKKPIYYQQTGSLENFLETTVNSTYLDALTNAGYGVGRGTFSPGKIDPMV